MCSAPVCVKQEAAEIVLDLPGLGRGDSSRAGASARKQSSEPSSPSLSPLLTPKAETSEAHQELDDDLLLSLRVLFDGVKLDDFDDDSDTDSEDAPPSPAAKGYDPAFILPTEKRTYFYAMGRLYFYDEERNVYLDNSPNDITLVHVGKPFMLDNNMDIFNPDFFIDGIPYYFDCISGALLYQDQGTIQNVCTWTSNSQTSTLNATFSPNFAPRTTSGGVFQSNSGFTPITFEFQQYSPEPASTGMFCKAKSEAETPNPNSLGNSLHGTMPWSPGSSMLSPIVSAGSRASSSEPLEPLIKEDYGVTAGIQMWQHEVKQIQEARAPSNKMDRRRCPQCNKLFRRPSSLEDHLNVHSGNKPHVCPYKDCKTGFATKSNMKRHFLTHRVGNLEDYHSGAKMEKSKSRTTTYNSKAFHTQRFRLTAS